MRGVAFALIVLAALVAGGCHGDGNQVLPLCDRLCECRSALPAFRDQCVEQCLGDLPPIVDLPADCTACIEESSCVDLARCADVCNGDAAGEGL